MDTTIETATVALSPAFEVFGAETELAVTARAVLNGVDQLTRRNGRSTLKTSPPMWIGGSRRFEVPVGDQPGWEDGQGNPVPAWSYEIRVVIRADGRSPVFWASSFVATMAQRDVVLEPASGTFTGLVSSADPTSVDPTTGGIALPAGGTTAVSADPDVAGAYLIGE